MRQPKCNTCKWYVGGKKVEGICRLNPPSPTFVDNGHTQYRTWLFPIVDPQADWCSHHTPKEVQHKKSTRTQNGGRNE